MISVLVPTRARTAILRNMIESLRATARGFPEVVAYVDEDDPERQTYHEMGDVKIVYGPRIILTQCWNECLRVATGDIVMQGNDDVLFRTPGWDMMVEEAFAACPDKILMVHGRDTKFGESGHTGFGPHPFVHRRWTDAIGYFIPPWFCSDHGDTWVNELARALSRREYIPFIVEHMHFVYKKAPIDVTYSERLERHKQDKPEALYAALAPVRKIDAEKLRRLMDKSWQVPKSEWGDLTPATPPIWAQAPSPVSTPPVKAVPYTAPPLPSPVPITPRSIEAVPVAPVEPPPPTPPPNEVFGRTVPAQMPKPKPTIFRRTPPNMVKTCPNCGSNAVAYSNGVERCNDCGAQG